MFNLEKEKQCNAEYAERVKERLITAAQYIHEDELKIDIVENLLGKTIGGIMNAIDEAEHEDYNTLKYYIALYFAMLAYSNYDRMQSGLLEEASLLWKVKDEDGHMCAYEDTYPKAYEWLLKLQSEHPEKQFHIDCNATDLMLELKNLHSEVEYDNAKKVRNHD